LLSTNSKEVSRVPGSKTLSQSLKCADTDFLDFLRRCFVWEPEKRMNPEEALCHPWILKGFPQLGAPSYPKPNVSLCIDKSDTARNNTELAPADVNKHYATHTKDSEPLAKPESKKTKPGLNQSMMNTMKNVSMQSTANLISVNMVMTPKNMAEPREGKLQDKLLQLKAKLKLMTTKTIPGSTKNSDKKSMMFHGTSKKASETKQSMKLSNLF